MCERLNPGAVRARSYRMKIRLWCPKTSEALPIIQQGTIKHGNTRLGDIILGIASRMPSYRLVMTLKIGVYALLRVGHYGLSNISQFSLYTKLASFGFRSTFNAKLFKYLRRRTS